MNGGATSVVSDTWKETNKHAKILAIGTATPAHIIEQSTYPDYYFNISNSDHLVEDKEKFQRMCDKSKIKKRHLVFTEELLKENPSLCTFDEATLNTRQDVMVREVPKLGKEAAEMAIEWTQPVSDTTHLIFCTTSGIDMPGADYRLTVLLGLNPTVKRLMMYQQGCNAGVAMLRIAKDISESNPGSHVLVVCVESMLTVFRGTCLHKDDNLLSQCLFGDGSSAVIIGSDPIPGVETPIFELVSAHQTIIPGTDSLLNLQLREMGMTFNCSKAVPYTIAQNIENFLARYFGSGRVMDWNSMFWAVHPGASKVLDQIEERLDLGTEKLRASRNMLWEYGNLTSASIYFVLDEMRNKSKREQKKTTGEGLDFGFVLAFGPGLTIDAVLVRSAPIQNN